MACNDNIAPAVRRYLGDAWFFSFTLLQAKLTADGTPVLDITGAPVPDLSKPQDLTGKVLSAELYSETSEQPLVVLSCTNDDGTDLQNGRFRFIATGGPGGQTQLFALDADSMQPPGPKTARLAVLRTDNNGNPQTLGIVPILVKRR